MLLRVVLFLGVLLVLAAGGAAGWQYWQNLPQSTAGASAPAGDGAAPAAGPAPRFTAADPAKDLTLPKQKWLISPGGGLVSEDSARVFLRQDRFVRGRRAIVEFRAPLTALLSAGEVLPEPVYQPAFAAIRAPALAEDLCQPLIDTFAEGCALGEATMKDNSYDPGTESAEFLVTLLFTVKSGAAPLPDLGSHVLRNATVRPASEAAVAAGSVQEVLALAGAAAQDACADIPTCRVSSLYVGANFKDEPTARVEYDYLAPLPKGMVAAPPLF